MTVSNALPDVGIDLITLLSLVLSAIAVIVGAALAKKSLWIDIGTQNWTIDSWATNIAAGTGILALVVKIIPGVDVPYTQLSAILGFIAGVAPTIYNLTTRAVGGVQKGKVLFFVLSAILTGVAIFGQLCIAFDALGTPSANIPAGSLIGLRTLVGLIGAAFAYHLFSGTRDTILAQSPGAPAETFLLRHLLPNGGFAAL
jgi:hypothetical protein